VPSRVCAAINCNCGPRQRSSGYYESAWCTRTDSVRAYGSTAKYGRVRASSRSSDHHESRSSCTTFCPVSVEPTCYSAGTAAAAHLVRFVRHEKCTQQSRAEQSRAKGRGQSGAEWSSAHSRAFGKPAACACIDRTFAHICHRFRLGQELDLWAPHKTVHFSLGRNRVASQKCAKRNAGRSRPHLRAPRQTLAPASGCASLMGARVQRVRIAARASTDRRRHSGRRY
jgi:hypothetical protein